MSIYNLSEYRQTPTRTVELGSGRVSAPRRTGTEMRDLIRKMAPNLYVRKWAEAIVSRVPDRDEQGEAEAIFHFVQNKLRYAKDPRGVEFVQSPELLLTQIERGETPSADCDDYTTLGLTLLRSLGYPVMIRVVGYGDSGVFSHVYGLVRIKGVWVPFDAVRKDVPFGYQPPHVRRRMDISV